MGRAKTDEHHREKETTVEEMIGKMMWWRA